MRLDSSDVIGLQPNELHLVVGSAYLCIFFTASYSILPWVFCMGFCLFYTNLRIS